MPTINPNGVATINVAANQNTIDGVNYAIEMSKTLADNVFVKLRTRVSLGVTGRYVENGADKGVVLINRVKRAGGKPRTMQSGGLSANAGTTGNNGLMNAKPAAQVATDQYAMPLFHKYDERFYIPRTAARNLPVDLANATVFNVSGEIQEYIDSSTIATYAAAACRYGSGLATANANMVKIGTGTKKYYTAVKDALKVLAKGDIANGIAAYTPSAIIARYDFALDLLSDEGVLAGGSNFAQSMIAKGALSPEEAYMQYGEGTMGMINGVPVIAVPDYVFVDLAAEWLADNGNVKNDAAANLDFLTSVQAFVVSDIATSRGIADNYLRVEQSTEANKTNVLPDWQWGVEALYGSGIVPIVNATTITNPYDATTNTMTVIGSGKIALPNGD